MKRNYSTLILTLLFLLANGILPFFSAEKWVNLAGNLFYVMLAFGVVLLFNVLFSRNNKAMRFIAGIILFLVSVFWGWAWFGERIMWAYSGK